MNIRLLLLSVLIGCAGFGCNSVQPEPTPAPPVNRDGGPHVDQGAPVAGGALFDSNH